MLAKGDFLLSSKVIKRYIEKGLLVRGIDERQIQPAGVDLTVAKVFSLKGKGAIDFSNEKRVLPEYEEIPPKNGKWDLPEGIYNITINEYVNLPRDVAALVLPRSSALVCGIEVHTALWDPGYHGRGMIYINVTRPVTIYVGARIAQMVFFRVEEPEKGYEGMYKGEDLLKFSRRGNVSSGKV